MEKEALIERDQIMCAKQLIKTAVIMSVISTIWLNAQITILDTTFPVDSRSSSWQSTGITVETGDHLYLFSWGAVVTHGVSMGNKIGAYLVDSDNTKGDNMQPYTNAGLGTVIKIGNNTPWPVGQVFRETHWTHSGGELYLGFNDNYHSDNQGSLVVGILRIRNGINKISNENSRIPQEFKLEQNHPNPFNPTTQIQYTLNKHAHIELLVYNSLGKLVRTLVDDSRSMGNYTELWDGKDDYGHTLSSGVYNYHLIIDGQVQSKKMILIK